MQRNRQGREEDINEEGQCAVNLRNKGYLEDPIKRAAFTKEILCVQSHMVSASELPSACQYMVYAVFIGVDSKYPIKTRINRTTDDCTATLLCTGAQVLSK